MDFSGRESWIWYPFFDLSILYQDVSTFTMKMSTFLKLFLTFKAFFCVFGIPNYNFNILGGLPRYTKKISCRKIFQKFYILIVKAIKFITIFKHQHIV